MSKLLKYSLDIVSNFTFKKLEGTSALKLELDEMLENEQYEEGYIDHYAIVKELAEKVEKMDDIAKVVTFDTFKCSQQQITQRK